MERRWELIVCLYANILPGLGLHWLSGYCLTKSLMCHLLCLRMGSKLNQERNIYIFESLEEDNFANQKSWSPSTGEK